VKFNHNIGRVEAFSDAVLAFAATLMVVSFNTANNFLELTAKLSGFITFGVSFFALILIWKVHYDFFRRTAYMDNILIALNSIFLFVVLYYIFPLKSLVNTMVEEQLLESDTLASLFELYGLGFLLIFLCVSLMYLRVYLKDKNAKNRRELQFQSRHFGIFVVVALISILIAMSEIGIQYGLAGFIYFLMGPLSYWNAVWFNKHVKKEDS